MIANVTNIEYHAAVCVLRIENNQRVICTFRIHIHLISLIEFYQRKERERERRWDTGWLQETFRSFTGQLGNISIIVIARVASS